jgi:FkbM family methyltransferase
VDEHARAGSARRLLRRSVYRVVGAASRRLERPELLAAVDGTARQAQREAIAIEAILAATLPADGTYVDVGANRGQILEQALRVAPAGRHVAFEPIPALAEEIRHAFAAVDCRTLALGASPEVTQFCYFRDLDGWSGLRRSPEVSDKRGRPEYITVQVSTLDAELKDARPNVLKVDVEGAELGVLEGARELLARARPVIILEHVAEASQLYGVQTQDVWDFLNGIGYEVFPVTGERGPLDRSQFAQPGDTVNWLARPRRR